MTKLNLRSRRGVAEVATTIFAIPVIAMVIGFMAYFGRALYARAAIEDAAATGARWAVTSLTGKKGCEQAHAAMALTLQGYYLDPNGAHLSVQPLGAWGRGEQVEVRVAYRVNQSKVLFFSRMLGDTMVQTRYVVRIDRYVNHYQWQPCVASK